MSKALKCKVKKKAVHKLEIREYAGTRKRSERKKFGVQKKGCGDAYGAEEYGLQWKKLYR